MLIYVQNDGNSCFFFLYIDYFYFSSKGDTIGIVSGKVKWDEEVVLTRDTWQASRQECGCLICQVRVVDSSSLREAFRKYNNFFFHLADPPLLPLAWFPKFYIFKGFPDGINCHVPFCRLLVLKGSPLKESLEIKKKRMNLPWSLLDVKNAWLLRPLDILTPALKALLSKILWRLPPHQNIRKRERF